ncbi:amidohydrolase family protein [Actibacterium sp. 188UL27-1]|uniref:amidohydrolase family protein n=1 Tax=Actibacterium sp. 188UL27-1 TaxID=2786961 RepID=UPI00195E8BDA|nr:amidohydrolase [Actibacterium sp. 188UL27-1]MBM7067207.1 amidohydrolase [Actibacterium sp. 188UL27-1]
MSIAITGAEILVLDADHGAKPFTADLLIQGDRIIAIGPDLDLSQADQTIDGRGKLVMPGLVNAHMHSPEALYKGRYDNMPLEVWMLYAYPILGAQVLSPRLVYLRTALCAIESLKSGTTCVTDDVYESPHQTPEQLDAVFQAYDDVGLRATISGHIVDRPFLDTIPFVRDFVGPDLAAQADALGTGDAKAWLAHCKEAFTRHHGRSGRLNFMVAPSAPQRCTVDLMQAAMELAEAHDAPFHTHILETKMQAVTGPEFYGETLIAYMHRHGLLRERTTIAHSIWVTDPDIELMGDARCSIAHNVISNQKLGAGVAPVRRLLDAGVNVALGSDGVSTSDTTRMFAVMHAAGLIHNVQTPDTAYWLSAPEILRAATSGGAKSACLPKTGTLEAGHKADMLVIDLATVPFTPRNNIANHLVYCETGSSITHAIVGGQIMAQDGTCLHVDEAALLAELREEMPAFLAQHTKTEAMNQAFEAAFWQAHKKANACDIGLHRLGQEPAWLQ